MKLLSPIVGLLFVAIWVPATRADISLTLRNKPYLPPPIQEVPINVHGSTQQQHGFREDKYANSRYQIFEVHNHYEPASTNGNNEYLPPPQEEEIHIQHINAPADFRFDDPNLDASYLGLASGSDSNNQQIIVKHETRIAATNNNHNPSNNVQAHNVPTPHVPAPQVPVPFPSNYQHKFPEKSPKSAEYLPPQQNFKSSGKPVKPTHKNQRKQQQVVNNLATQQQIRNQQTHHRSQKHHTSQHSIPKSNNIKGKEYLPPIPTKSVAGRRPIQNGAQNPLKSPENLPPHTSNKEKSPNKGPDYLPPRQGRTAKQNTGFKGPEIPAPHQPVIAQQQQHQPQDVFQQHSQLKGPDYLPPHQAVAQHQQNAGFKGPETAAVHQKVVAQQQQHNALQQQHQQHQQQQQQQQHHQQHQQQQQQQQQHQQQTSFQQNSPFKGPDYLPPHQDGSAQTSFQQNSAFKGPDYLPPHHDGQIQQQKSIQQSNYFKGPDYLPPYNNQVQHQQQPLIQNQGAVTNFRASAYLPPGYDFQKPENSEQAIAELHTLPEQSQQYQQEVTVGTQIQVAGREQSSDIVYGTPKQANPPQVAGYLPPGYVAPKPESFEQSINQLHTQGSQQQSINQFHSQGSQQLSQQQSTSLKGTEYLPPGYDFQKPENSEQAIQQLHTLDVSEPRQQNGVATLDKANEYLPPGYDFQKTDNSEQVIQQLHSTGSNVQQTTGYLPPGYDFQKPVEAEQINQNVQTQSNTFQTFQNQQQTQEFNQAPQQQLPQQQLTQSYTTNAVSQSAQSYQSQQYQPQITQQSQSFQSQGSQQHSYSESLQEVKQIAEMFKGSDYLPPLATTSQSASVSNRAPDYLPPVASSQNQFQQINQPSFQSLKGPDYLPPVSSAPNYPASQQPQFKAPDYLPPPASSPPQLQQINQPSVQQFSGPDYLPPVQQAPVASSQPQFQQINQQISQQSFKGPDYLPPVSSAPNYQQINQPSVQQFSGPDYLPPVQQAPVASSVNYQSPVQQLPQQVPAFKAPDYLPPTEATPIHSIQPTIMYPLSSYMTTVQPHERYGSTRKPFPEYGLPPTAATISNDVSSMYREAASRPQYYAPTMSYSNNAVNTQTYTTFAQNQQYQQGSSALNQQTRQTLQTLMPKDLRQETSHDHGTSTNPALGATTALQTTKPATSKIRTVQIVNPTNVKTLDVLESLDHAGVKTIKILGPSNKQPMGNHSVVKVVSGQTEQTVKIFNDHQDVNTSEVQAGQSNANNAYLPPRRKRNPKKSSSSSSSKGRSNK